MVGQYKTCFVSASIDQSLNFGNHTSNRVESQHAKLKKYLESAQSVKLKGYPKALMFTFELFKWGGYVTPWVKEIVENLKCLQCVKFKRMIVHDSDLEVLAEGCGEKLKVLKIEACSGFSTDGLLHIGRKCSGLRTLCLQTSFIDPNGAEWLHELALRNKCIESLNFYLTPLVNFDYEDLVLIAKNCSESLVSLKLRGCPRKYFVEIFRYVVNLEDFGGGAFIDEGEEYIDLKFPPKMRRVMWNHGTTLDIPIIRRFEHQLTKLDLIRSGFGGNEHIVLIHKCPNLEELYTKDTIGDFGIQVASHFCKKLRRIKIESSGQEGLDMDPARMSPFYIMIGSTKIVNPTEFVI
ncbi:hypothetical protein CTI12_AA482210 [Artemisia annua]|uniref:Transport inhibitor response 1 domain-containing protein n=1 Tax=Artemisia annua TaxID=35608 RepID=A0A2U1LK59_ARTAN|nr:hypothetical protein CTI12_AA482210 [Artemisia annua]